MIDVEGISTFEELLSFANETVDGVEFDFGNGDLILLEGTQLAALDRDAFTFY